MPAATSARNSASLPDGRGLPQVAPAVRRRDTGKDLVKYIKLDKGLANLWSGRKITKKPTLFAGRKSNGKYQFI
jgi:hypothetical protein